MTELRREGERYQADRYDARYAPQGDRRYETSYEAPRNGPANQVRPAGFDAYDNSRGSAENPRRLP